jgi:hypothetical protein
MFISALIPQRMTPVVQGTALLRVRLCITAHDGCQHVNSELYLGEPYYCEEIAMHRGFPVR